MLKLDALQEKPWYLQLAVFGGVALVLYAAFWYFVTSSTRAETHEIEAKVEQLLRANAGAVVASQRLNEFKANYERAKADYEDLKLLLPEQRELTMVLQNVQDRARGRLVLTKFTPQEEEQKDFYTGKPVQVGVTGSYNNLGQVAEADGDLPAALAHHEQALAIRRAFFGDDHVETARSLHNLGVVLGRLGRTDEARDAYRRARELTDDGAERRFLERRLTELASSPGTGTS